MDICSFFGGANSSKSADVSSSGEDEVDSNQSDSECLEPSPAKKWLTVQEKCRSKWQLVTSSRKYNKKWEESFSWLTYNENYQGTFCKICRKRGTWISKLFKNWKEAIKKMKTHAKRDIHIQSYEVQVASARALQGGLIVQQLQQFGDQEKLMNRMAIKAFIRCTLFLSRCHIPTQPILINSILIVSCGAEDLKWFLERAGKMHLHIQHSCYWICWSSWVMGWRMPTGMCSQSIQLQHSSRWVHWCDNHWRAFNFLPFCQGWATCWALFRHSSLESHWCQNHLFCPYQVHERQKHTDQQVRGYGIRWSSSFFLGNTMVCRTQCKLSTVSLNFTGYFIVRQ